MSESHRTAAAVFDAALQLPPAQWAAYLEAACGGDARLRQRVEALLRAHQSAGAFMDTPAAAPWPASGPGLPAAPDTASLRPEDLAPTRPALEHEPPQEPVDEAVGQTIGRYRLLERLGEGGCGVVYVAEQTEPVRRRVALKVIKLGMDTRQVIARFEAERQALAMMDHPNIAKVLDGGTTGARDQSSVISDQSSVISDQSSGGGDRGVRREPLITDHCSLTTDHCSLTTASGRPYFVMELVRGIPITQYCDQAHLTTRQRLELFIQVCQAIQHAHQKGIIHRDIKPSNILVTLHDGVPVPKVIDFGIAKAIEGRLTEGTVFTQLHQFIGTPAYMSPEQAEMTGLDIDTRSDIYSLGVLLYELLAGSTPFDAQQLMASGLDAMRKIIREQEPPRPSTRLTRDLARLESGSARASRAASGASPEAPSSRPSPDARGPKARVFGGAPKTAREARALPEELRTLISALRGDLDWIVMKCLEKDRTRRYETANGLALDLKRHLNDEPVLARPPSAAYRFRKAFRRHRLVFSAAMVVAVALVGGIAVSTWQTFAARKAQRETEEARENESKAIRLLRVQMHETEKAKRSAEEAAQSEGEQRRRAEEALQTMQVQKAEEFFVAHESALAVGCLGRMLRAHPSNEVAAARLTSAMLRPFPRELTEPLVHRGIVMSARFSPDGLRVVTASLENAASVRDARTGQLMTPPLQHDAAVIGAEFSPDGLRVLTASHDSTARVWDAHTGQPLTAPLRHERAVIAAQFSPDGLRVVTASHDSTARVWDAHTGQPLTAPLRHAGALNSAQFGPEGLRVVTASHDSTARVWDAHTGQPLTAPFRHAGALNSAEFSLDGLRVVTASHDSTARVWDAHTGQPLTAPLRHERAVIAAQFSPDGLRVVTASHDATARVWDAHTGQPLTAPLRHTAELNSAQFSPNGLRLVTASHDLTARVWDVRTGQPVVEPLRHARNVLSAQFSPDGTQVVTACGDQTARVWDARPGAELTEPLRHGGEVCSARFSPDGLQVVTASGDQTARIWSVRSARPVTEPLRHEARVRDAQFSPDGLRVVTASDDQTARLWDARTGQPLLEPLRHAGGLTSAQFSPDGSTVVTASWDGTARVWDAHTGLPMTGPLRDPGVSSAQFSPDGGRVVTAATGTWARVWDVRTSQPVGEPLPHRGFVVFAQFSPDGLRVVTASHDFTARVWDAQTGQPVTHPLEHRERVTSAQFSRDGSRVVTASLDKTARIWDARTGQPICEPLRHAGTVWFAEFSPSGSRVVTASEDQTARVWDARTGQPVSEPLQHEAAVHAAQFSPDGLRVVTASTDRTARIWDVDPAPLPVPDWFLDWAETRIGHRFAAGDGTEGIPFAEQRQQREQVQSRPDTTFYTRLAQWVEADPTTRTVSPNAVVTMPEHVRRLMDANTIASLREALALSPAESLAWGRLALHLAAGEGEQNPEDRLTEAEWDARHALKLDPHQGEARQALEAIRALRP